MAWSTTISNGAGWWAAALFCAGCEEYLEDGKHVFTLIAEAKAVQEFFCCQACRPADSELPAAIKAMETALVVEDLERDEEAAVYEVKEGSECRFCGHLFDMGEWVLVGVFEESYDGQLFCEECHFRLINE